MYDIPKSLTVPIPVRLYCFALYSYWSLLYIACTRAMHKLTMTFQAKEKLTSLTAEERRVIRRGTL